MKKQPLIKKLTMQDQTATTTVVKKKNRNANPQRNVLASDVARISVIEKMVLKRRMERSERSAGFCPKCGQAIQQSDIYCPGCGEKVLK